MRSYEVKLIGNSLVLLWIPAENGEEFFNLRNEIISTFDKSKISVNKIIHTSIFYYERLTDSDKENVLAKIKELNKKLSESPFFFKVNKIGLWKDYLDIKSFGKSFDLYENLDYMVISEKVLK